ncbi:MAG: FAD-binding oxidoreductase [Gemmatimonadaceae bacterium]
MPLDTPAGFRGAFRLDDDARAVYSEAAGIGRAWPRAVAVPRDSADVSLLVRWARDRGHAIIPRGSGSSMAGGAIGDGIVLDLSRLRDVAEPLADATSIHAGAGVLRGELDQHAQRVGQRFPVDPSSGEFCTLGGMAATNAAGPHSLRHGPMRPWVLGLDCVFDDGTLATIRRGEPPPATVPAIARFLAGAQTELLDRVGRGGIVHDGVLKESSGYAVGVYAQTRELIDLLVGSEGTLAIFTAVEVAIIPAAAARASVLVSFAELERAAEAAVASRAHGAAACELLDRTFLLIAASGGVALPVSPLAEAVLLIDVEADSAAAARAMAEGVLAQCRLHGVLDAHLALEPAREAALWSLRHAASPALARMDSRLRSMQFIEDAAVPPQALAEYVRGVRAILASAGTEGVIFGHAGDAHVHVNPLLDVDDPRWRERLEHILLEVTELVARLGGTSSGEHGDGRLRTPLLDKVWSREALACFSAVKRSFDPSAIFNPGVKVPLAGQRAVDAVKYDPTLDALPARARAALELVDRERAYARFRMDLL